MRPLTSRLAHAALMSAAIALTACAAPRTVPKSTPAPLPVYAAYVAPPVFMLDCLMPPTEMLAAAEHESARLELDVSAEGRVTDVHVLQSAGGPPAVDAALASAARACRFRPAKQDGVPVATSFRLSPHWRKDVPAQGLARCFAPPYPTVSQRLGTQGTTEVAFMFASAADAPTVRLIRSSGDPRLDRLTLDWANQCMARPEVRAGIPVQKWIRAPISWALEPAKDTPATAPAQ